MKAIWTSVLKKVLRDCFIGYLVVGAQSLVRQRHYILMTYSAGFDICGCATKPVEIGSCPRTVTSALCSIARTSGILVHSSKGCTCLRTATECEKQLLSCLTVKVCDWCVRRMKQMKPQEPQLIGGPVASLNSRDMDRLRRHSSRSSSSSSPIHQIMSYHDSNTTVERHSINVHDCSSSRLCPLSPDVRATYLRLPVRPRRR